MNEPVPGPSDYLFNLCLGKPVPSVLPSLYIKGSHLLAGYGMETAMHIMRGKRAAWSESLTLR